jgi:hypothetical protein
MSRIISRPLGICDVNYCQTNAHAWGIGVRFSTYGVQEAVVGLGLAAFPAGLEIRFDGPDAVVFSLGC